MSFFKVVVASVGEGYDPTPRSTGENCFFVGLRFRFPTHAVQRVDE